MTAPEIVEELDEAAEIDEPIPDVVITEPGVYPDIPDAVYHGDPVPATSLSSSGAKRLLSPSCPAIFDYERKHGRADKKAFDLGHGAHKLVLGVGAEIVEVEADDWRTKAAKEEGKAARARGAVPLLTKDYETVHAMAAALRDDPIAGKLFQLGDGTPEASIFWIDEETSIWRRARTDWLPDPSDGRMILIDYKSAVSANPTKFAKAAADYGYYMQAPWYVDGVEAAGLSDDAAFVFVVQEKTPPYLVSVVQLDATAMRIGRARNREAIEIFRDCTDAGIWPTYSSDVELISLPPWFERQYEEIR